MIRFIYIFISLFFANRILAIADLSFGYTGVAVGSADYYGYARVLKTLCEIDFEGEKNKIPIVICFKSDLRTLSDNLAGSGWGFPLFESKLIETTQNKVRWQRPDGRISFFRKSIQDGKATFLSRDAQWEALKNDNRNWLLIHKITKSELEYRNGHLAKISYISEDGRLISYIISYNGDNLPYRLTRSGHHDAKITIAYSQRKIQQIIIDDTKFVFTYLSAKLENFGASPYLENIVNSDESILQASYLTNGRSNTVTFDRTISTGINKLTWEPMTGFLINDNLSDYSITNKSLANGGRILPKNKVNPGLISGFNWTPERAIINRKAKNGNTEFKHYDKKTGVLHTIDLNGLERWTYYLLSPGPMRGQIRKIEELRGGKRVITLRIAYDDVGRIIRQSDEAGRLKIFTYLDQKTSKIRTIISDDIIIFNSEYDKQGRLISQKQSIDNSIIEKRFTYNGNQTIVQHFSDGRLLSSDLFVNGVISNPDDSQKQE
jgi:hypothetical protein